MLKNIITFLKENVGNFFILLNFFALTFILFGAHGNTNKVNAEITLGYGYGNVLHSQNEENDFPNILYPNELKYGLNQIDSNKFSAKDDFYVYDISTGASLFVEKDTIITYPEQTDRPVLKIRKVQREIGVYPIGVEFSKTAQVVSPFKSGNIVIINTLNDKNKNSITKSTNDNDNNSPVRMVLGDKITFGIQKGELFTVNTLR